MTFTLEKDGAAATLSDVPVILYWDAAKVRAAMSEEIMSQVTLSSIGGGDGKPHPAQGGGQEILDPDILGV